MCNNLQCSFFQFDSFVYKISMYIHFILDNDMYWSPSKKCQFYSSVCVFISCHHCLYLFNSVNDKSDQNIRILIIAFF